MEGFYMSANIIRLLPDEERALLECYVAGSQHPASFQQLFDTMEVPTDAVPDRLQKGITRMKKMYEQAWVELLQKERFERHRELFKEREWWVNFCRWKRAQHGITRRSTGGTLHKMPGSKPRAKCRYRDRGRR